MACEQEECVEEEFCNKLSPELPELYRAQESVQDKCSRNQCIA